jgi:uncharacterized membrane protein
MNTKTIVPFMVLAIVAPLYVAVADDTSTATGNDTATATTTDCGSAPTAPAAGATLQDRQTYKQALQQYRQCKMANFKSENQNLKTQGQQLTQEHCTLVNQRITTRINNFTKNEGSDKTVFGNVYQRLLNIATRLKGDNLDTTTLTNDLSILKTKIDKVSTDYASFISALQALTSSTGPTCGQSQGQFADQLASARTILLTVRQDRLDVRSYILNTIKPDILALRQQLVKQGQTSSASGSGSTTATTTIPSTVQ